MAFTPIQNINVSGHELIIGVSVHECDEQIMTVEGALHENMASCIVETFSGHRIGVAHNYEGVIQLMISEVDDDGAVNEDKTISLNMCADTLFSVVANLVTVEGGKLITGMHIIEHLIGAVEYVTVTATDTDNDD